MVVGVRNTQIVESFLASQAVSVSAKSNQKRQTSSQLVVVGRQRARTLALRGVLLLKARNRDRFRKSPSRLPHSPKKKRRHT